MDISPSKKTLQERIESIRYSLFESPNRAEVWIIILLLILNVALRLPTTPHPIGIDTYKTIWETRKTIESNEPIVEHGPWLIRWRMFTLKGIEVGFDKGIRYLYPFSDPILFQMNYAMLQQVTSIDVEMCLLVISILCGVLGFLSSYIMARQFVENKLMVYVIAFFYSTAPTFLYVTTWQGTFRMMYMALFPVLIWCFFKYNNTRNKSYVVFSIYLSLALFFLHRMGLLLPLVYAGFIAANVLSRAVGFLERRASFTMRVLPHVISVTYILLFMFLMMYPFFSSKGFFVNLRYEYASGVLTEGFQAPRVALNMIVDYFQNNGILLLMAFIGFIILVEKLRRPVKNINYVVVAFITLLFAPLLLEGEYMTLYLIPMLGIIVSLGFKGVLSFIEAVSFPLRLQYPLPQIFVVGTILLSAGFSAIMSYYWIITPPASHLKVNNYIDETSIAAVAYIDALPGRVIIPPFLNLLVHFSSRTKDYDKIELGWETYAWSIHTRQNTIYLYQGNVSYAVEYEVLKGSWAGAYGEVAESALLIDLRKERDKIYANGAINVWDSRPDIRDMETYKDSFTQYPNLYDERKDKVWFGGV